MADKPEQPKPDDARLVDGPNEAAAYFKFKPAPKPDAKPKAAKPDDKAKG